MASLLKTEYLQVLHPKRDVTLITDLTISHLHMPLTLLHTCILPPPPPPLFLMLPVSMNITTLTMHHHTKYYATQPLHIFVQRKTAIISPNLFFY